MPTAIYLSAHLDDAALSCGGLIHQQTRRGSVVAVVTLCAGDPPSASFSPFAEALHARWQLSPSQAVARRREEDHAALRGLGAAVVHLPVPDCIYRRHPVSGEFLYASETALFDRLHPVELGVAGDLARSLTATLAAWPDAQVYAPLGIGRHVDHQLTRRAAEQLGRPLFYYEDYPYAERAPAAAEWGGLAAGLQPVTLGLEEADLQAYCQSVAAYRSQVSTFWPDEAAMMVALRGFATRTGAGQPAVRVWHQA